MPFVKLDCGMLDSTIWSDREAREMFITALLMAEPIEVVTPKPQIEVNSLKLTGWEVPPGWYGFVPAAGPGIVRRSGVDAKDGLAALERLGNPDDGSRTPDFEGRRMVRVDGGYIILNFIRYRERDYTSAERSARYRANKKLRHAVATVTSRVTSQPVTQAEAEAEAEEYTKKERKSKFAVPSIEEVKLQAQKIGLPEHEAEKFFSHYGSNGWRVGKNRMESMPHAIVGWKLRWEEGGKSNGNGKPINSELSGADKMNLLGQQDRINKRLSTIRNQYDSHQTWSQSDKDECKELKIKLAEINQKLGCLL